MAKKKRARQKFKTSRAKNGYLLPNGDYVSVGEPSVTKSGRAVRIVGVHRAEPDVKKLARAFVELAEQLARERAQHEQDDKAA